MIDQLGVANFAYTLGSADLVYNLKHRFAYVFVSQTQFYSVGLQTEFRNFSLHIFVLQTLLGILVWGNLPCEAGGTRAATPGGTGEGRHFDPAH